MARMVVPAHPLHSGRCSANPHRCPGNSPRTVRHDRPRLSQACWCLQGWFGKLILIVYSLVPVSIDKKYSFLFSVWKCDETLSMVFDYYINILLMTQPEPLANQISFTIYLPCKVIRNAFSQCRRQFHVFNPSFHHYQFTNRVIHCQITNRAHSLYIYSPELVYVKSQNTDICVHCFITLEKKIDVIGTLTK